MVSAEEYNPIVRLPETAGYLVIDSLIIPRFFKPKPAVTGDNKQGVLQAVLYAQLIDNTFEIAVDVPGDYNLFCVRVFEKLVHFSFILLHRRCLQEPTQ